MEVIYVVVVTITERLYLHWGLSLLQQSVLTNACTIPVR